MVGKNMIDQFIWDANNGNTWLDFQGCEDKLNWACVDHNGVWTTLKKIDVAVHLL